MTRLEIFKNGTPPAPGAIYAQWNFSAFACSYLDFSFRFSGLVGRTFGVGYSPGVTFNYAYMREQEDFIVITNARRTRRSRGKLSRQIPIECIAQLRISLWRAYRDDGTWNLSL